MQFNMIKRILFGLSFLILLSTISYAQNDNLSKKHSHKFATVDSHIHNGFTFENDKIVLSNFKYFDQREVDTFIFPLPVDRSKTDNLYIRVKEEIGQLRLLSEQSKRFRVVDSIASINKLSTEGIPNLILSIECFDGIFGGNLKNADGYYNLGVRYITIIDSDSERLFEENSLTPFGKELINSMNKTGILIDISHLSDDQKLLVIDYSDSPVIVSHSNTRKYADISYNLSDEVLEALSLKKGYVFVSFNENDLYKGENREIDAINQFINHIDYLINFLGNDYVGIGSDYQANGKYVPQQLNEITTYNKIQEKLVERGFSNENVRKIIGDNVLKALGTYK